MEKEATAEETFVYPPNLNTFAPPNDKALQFALNLHKPSNESLTLKSELDRTVYPEAFIQHRNLGTLADLCLRALGAEYGVKCVPFFAKHKLLLQTINDAIDIESPLEKIYMIEDNEFWKRLVLAKTTDNKMKFQKDPFDWKSLGISLKYTEMVEQCPAEFWPEKRMETLATNVKDFVKEFHIHTLQSLKDYVFEPYLHRDSDTDKSDSTDVSSTTAEEKESTISSVEEEGEEEQVAEQKGAGDAEQIASAASSEIFLLEEGGGDSLFPEFRNLRLLQLEWADFEARRAVEKARVVEERREARRARREAQQKRRELREDKLRMRREQLAEPKPTKIVIKNVFDLPVEEMEDNENKLIDKRNPEKLIRLKRNYEYPPKHCHHIDLKFVRLFDHLEEFSIEFHPPPLLDKYHQRHFNFSYDDVEHLADGISGLETLRVFRLRDSRMDERKLRMLTNVLRNMNVEVLDFGNDHLLDDCDDAIFELFQGSTTLKSLELEGNFFNVNVLRRLSMALRKYEGALEYLGLARNPLSDEALHALCVVIHKTAQVQHLNLSGIQFSQPTISCCVANELLGKHKVLKKLELIGMPIGEKAAIDILKAMKENQSIVEVDCRGCDLPFEFEYEIAVCLRRNRYIVENPYIGDPTQTEDEIATHVKRIKNPVLLQVMEEMKKRQMCLDHRPDVAERFSETSISSANVRKHSESVFSMVPLRSSQALSKRSTQETEIELQPFVFNPNQFNLQEFHTHVLVPGPGQRYYYFSERKERTLCSRED